MTDHPRLKLAEVEMANHYRELRARQAEHQRAAEALALEAMVTGKSAVRWCDPDEDDVAEALEAMHAFPLARWWSS